MALSNIEITMKYILITKNGTVMQFYIKSVAELYQSFNGGVIIQDDLFESTETV